LDIEAKATKATKATKVTKASTLPFQELQEILFQELTPVQTTMSIQITTTWVQKISFQNMAVVDQPLPLPPIPRPLV
jgi:hypothetical protein